MTQQVSFVNQHGEIKQWISPGMYSNYIEGETYNGLTAVYLPGDTDISEFQKVNVYVNGSWVQRIEQPSFFHIWENGTWVFQQDLFNKELRRQRDQKLFSCDWTQLADAPLSTEEKTDWSIYRQQLRDLPQINEATELENIIWPTPPHAG